MAQTRHLVLGLMPRGADPDTHWAAGPWCFDTEEDFFPGWEDSFVFGREPLRDPATLDRAVLMAQSLTVDSIPALGRHLLDLQRRRAEENNPVSTLLGPDEIDLPGVYWETLLTPWACTVARQLVERWLRVRAMVEDWGHLPLHVELLPEDCAFSFATEHDFVMSGALGADWNTWLMSRLLESVWPERWTRSYALPVCASYGRLIPPEDSGSLKQRLRAWARSCVLRLPCPPLRGMRLHQALRYSLALLHPSRQPDASRPLAAHFGSAATGVKHDLPLDPLPIFIGALPQTLAELDHPDHVAPARVPRVRVASVRAHEDTHYRQKLALWRARGHRVMFVQHGGNVGQVRCLCETPLVEFSQHAFGTWGWSHYEATGAGKGGQFLPLPYPLLANMADQWRGGDDTLLFVGAEMPLYGHRLDSRPTPQTLAELDHPDHVAPARVPRVRVASVRAHEDTHYRQKLALWRARGHRVMFVQHGGNVGQVRCLCETPLVEFSQHAFGTWGWSHYEATGAGKGGQFLPLPYPLLANMADQWRGGDDTLLFVGAEMPLYGHRLDSRPTPLQWLQYREDKQWFLEDLPRRLHDKILYRPHFDAPGALDDAPWLLPRFPHVRLCSGPLEARMLTCALMVLDHHGTTLLQALAANVPTIAYWDRSIWPMTDEALARLDLLAEAGIWQPSAEAAAAKVREVWDNPARWWLDERVQSARRAFCREHAFVDPKGPDAHIVSLLQRL